ncbi:MAG: thioredoxin domain-containing protein [Bdellovibrionales bacterium]|nr:thioredoxin domain-containing protein [Bdellovibrionales bacterium]
MSCLGIVDSLWLIYVHWNYESVGQACSISSNISCEAIRYKQYSEWFSIPVPFFSLCFYLLLVIFLYLIRSKDGLKDRRYISSVMLMSGVSFLVSLYFGLVSWMKLELLCMYCFVLYVISLLNVLASWNLYRSFSEFSVFDELCLDVEELLSKHRKKAILFILMCCALLASAWAYSKQDFVSIKRKENTASGSRATGNPDAKVKIVIFSDFQCPACRMGAQVMGEIERVYSHKVQISYKYYPLDPACNEKARYGVHFQACEAAKASYCASMQGRFWRFHDQLFDRQKELGERLYLSLAEKEGLDLSQFKRCMVDEDTQSAVVGDIQAGDKLGVDATPSIFVNGRRYSGPLRFSSLKKVIESFE